VCPFQPVVIPTTCPLTTTRVLQGVPSSAQHNPQGRCAGAAAEEPADGARLQAAGQRQQVGLSKLITAKVAALNVGVCCWCLLTILYPCSPLSFTRHHPTKPNQTHLSKPTRPHHRTAPRSTHQRGIVESFTCVSAAVTEFERLLQQLDKIVGSEDEERYTRLAAE